MYWWQIFLVILGVCILLCGVLILSWQRSVAAEEELLEDRMLLGHDVEGFTELYDDDSFGGNSSNTRIEEMSQDGGDVKEINEKTPLLSKN